MCETRAKSCSTLCTLLPTQQSGSQQQCEQGQVQLLRECSCCSRGLQLLPDTSTTRLVSLEVEVAINRINRRNRGLELRPGCETTRQPILQHSTGQPWTRLLASSATLSP